jgi:cytochrome c-type biogenesis protein CcmH
VIIFIVVCAAMVTVALTLVARPLLRGQLKARVALPVLIVLFPTIALLFYLRVGHRTWEQDQALAQSQATSQQDLAANIARLERRVSEEPNDVDAMLSLGEALAAQDERALSGRAGELFELAIARAPDNAKALWYGAINALSAGKLPLARERLQRVLLQNPPDNIRSIIERQIQDIDQQLGEKPTPAHALNVQVSLSPELATTVDKNTSLFVLARDPVNGGPPLAVARRSVGDLPLSVTLTDNDAMIAGHGISSVPRIQVVARISKSGAPQAQIGDLYGDATVEIAAAQAIAVKITINRKVEK